MVVKGNYQTLAGDTPLPCEGAAAAVLCPISQTNLDISPADLISRLSIEGVWAGVLTIRREALDRERACALRALLFVRDGTD